MTTSKTIVLQIDQFCNCEGHVQQVKDTFCALGGVKLLKMDPEIGKFTISTTKHPDAIKYALERAFSKKKVILFENPKHQSQPRSIHNHQNVIINNNHIYQVTPPRTTNFDDMARALATISHVQGLQSVEITNMKLNFNNSEDRPTSRRSKPASNARHACTTLTAMPSAPQEPVPRRRNARALVHHTSTTTMN
ncbi:hypothetical protein L2E82_32174 [Cichorium intybus]|uniref:Uncharacterized protein n=1 Tax=Cichorium intybus TaxID=13427 RepID=A0ACB9BGH4_CICIN|nr:hypothetical protein L2E82_32174 [Cichorium intybus]